MENCLSVGFARADITPDPVTGYPLGGYGATHRRLSQNLLERLSAHVLCVGEGETPKAFLITCDTTNGYAALVLKLRADLSRATGFPEGMFLIGGTHSHSTPDLSSPLPIIKEYLELISARVTEAVKQALSDLRPAKVFYNSVEVGHPGSRLNFCRHYVIAPNGSYNHESAGNTLYCGDNFNDNLAWDYEHYHYVRHAQEVDPMLQTVRFAREDAEDVVLVNFQAHAHITGGTKKYDMSGDFPAALIQRMEKLKPGTKFIYYNGACGNINPHSRMQSDSLPGLTFGQYRDYIGYASILSGYVMEALDHEISSESAAFGFRHLDMMAERDHSLDSRVKEAGIVAELFCKEGNSPAVYEFCERYGFTSPYECTSALWKASLPKEGDIEINALRFGDTGLVTCEGELFNDLGVAIKNQSPAALTLVKCYSNGNASYFASYGSPEGSYERAAGAFSAGTGEKIVETLTGLLKELFTE